MRKETRNTEGESLPAPDFQVETDPASEDIQFLEDRLYEFNSSTTGITDGQMLAIFVRDDAGKIIGGIAGFTWGGYCQINQLWVAESQRKKGLGSRLLAAAEAEARRRKAALMFLTTHSFQAPGFYAKYGFEVLYAIAEQPHGYQHFLLRKVLAD